MIEYLSSLSWLEVILLTVSITAGVYTFVKIWGGE